VDLILFRRPAPAVREPNQSVTTMYGRLEMRGGNAAWLPLRVLGHLLSRPFRPPRILPGGGSSSAGSLGYLNAALELDAQVREGRMPLPDVIYVPLGSGGTAAGLLAGISLLRWETRIVAVRVSTPWISNRHLPVTIARGALRMLRRAGAPRRSVRSDLLEVEGRFYGGRYGRPTRSGREAADRVMDAEGIDLDQTYTAKTMAALLGRARDGGFRGKTVLYVHTFNSRNLHRLLET
jgi:D-cysteine desulfhydrase